MSSVPILAHISDFHASTFGETFHDRERLIKRSNQPFKLEERHQLHKEISGWKLYIERPAKAKEQTVKDKRILLDPAGYEHPIPDPPKKQKEDTSEQIDQRASEYVLGLEARYYKRLARDLPEEAEVLSLLQATPTNTNLRLLRAAHAVIANKPDLILITGDLTDNGQGYELVEALFAPWKEQGRLLAVPGNHDLYLFPFGGSVRPKPTHESKRKAWQSFASRVGLELDSTGAWVREFPEWNTMIVGLDSCAMGQSRFLLHSGAIGKAQLNFLRGVASTSGWQNAQCRIVAMHHHLVSMQRGIGKTAPTEIGMRLEDATEVAEVLNQVGATFVMHGHRHISEARQPAGCHFQLLSTASLTLGCRSGDVPSYWKVELSERPHFERVRLSLPAIDPELDDPNLVEV